MFSGFKLEPDMAQRIAWGRMASPGQAWRRAGCRWRRRGCMAAFLQGPARRERCPPRERFPADSRCNFLRTFPAISCGNSLQFDTPAAVRLRTALQIAAPGCSARCRTSVAVVSVADFSLSRVTCTRSQRDTSRRDSEPVSSPLTGGRLRGPHASPRFQRAHVVTARLSLPCT